MGDFNIDLMKTDSQEDSNEYYNTLCSHFFIPYVLQPTHPISKTLIDNGFINAIEYSSYSGNLAIQLADHLLQFTLFEGFFLKTLPVKKSIFMKEILLILMNRNFMNYLIKLNGILFFIPVLMIQIFF